MSPLYVPLELNCCISLFQAYTHDAYLRGNNPYTGKAQNLPPPPPVLYAPRTKTQPPAGYPPSPAPASSHMGQNQLDNWSRWPGSSSGPSPPLDNRTVASNAIWAAEGRSCEPGGVGHSSPAHRTEEIQYGMTDRGQQATGQMRGHSYSSSSSSGGMMSPLHHAHLANHNVGHIGGRKESPPWPSPSQSTSTPHPAAANTPNKPFPTGTTARYQAGSGSGNGNESDQILALCTHATGVSHRTV